MKNTLYLFLLLAFTACQKQNNLSRCMSQSVEEYKKTDPCKGAAVDEYIFQGKKVYTFSPGNCGADMTTHVLDEDCRSLGYLGGFAGNTQINGEDFSTAKFERNIWKN